VSELRAFWSALLKRVFEIDVLARSGFCLLRAQKDRWTYRTSRGFSPLPAAGQTLLLKTALFFGLPGVVGGIFLLVREVSDLQLKI